MQQESPHPIFMIIDGSAFIHRAYHAYPEFRTTNGAPVGAVYGFFSMLLKMIEQIRPMYVCVAFDRPAPTFRKELYVGYQAQRPSAGADLGDQFEAVIELLGEIGIPTYAVDGYEADDVMGTIVEKVSAEKDIEVYMVTGDRDMMQLVKDNVKMLSPVLGISKMVLYDKDKVLEKFGVIPTHVVDYKALIGDPSDNYPGVAGIGPKTAIKLIQEYETIENLFEHITDIEKENKTLALKLANGADQAYLAKKLATIVRDVPFVFQQQDCLLRAIDAEKFKKPFKKYEFNSLMRRVDEVFGKKEITEKSKKQRQMKLL